MYDIIDKFLIYPYWNIKEVPADEDDDPFRFLIYPYWNIKRDEDGKFTKGSGFLIYPYWNIKYSPIFSSLHCQKVSNLSILEYKDRLAKGCKDKIESF